MNGSRTSPSAARLAALAAVALWGVSFVATKAALAELSPIALIFTRFGLGSVTLFGILWARRELRLPSRKAIGSLALMGFVGVFVHQLIQVHGLTLTTAVRTGWLIGLTPVWSAVLAAIALRERFGSRKVTGLALGLLGAILVVSRGDLSVAVLALPETRGDLLILASTVNWAIYTVLGRAALQRLGSSLATAGSIFFGWVMLAPLFVVQSGWQEYGSLSATTVVAVLFLGVGCSGLAYLFWYAALERLETANVAAFLYLEPLFTLAAAVALLQEPVALTTVLGGLVVLLGVALVQR